MAKLYSIGEIRQHALEGDVCFDMYRIYSDRIRANDPEVLAILGLGHVIESKKWLESTTDEGMQYGNADKNKRIEHAVNHADKAGIHVSGVAEIFGLTDLLPAGMRQPEDTE